MSKQDVTNEIVFAILDGQEGAKMPEGTNKKVMKATNSTKAYAETLIKRSKKKWKKLQKGEHATEIKTETKAIPESEFRFSAVGEDGKMMDIDKYCEFYNLPFDEVVEAKLVTHSSVPYYNTRFKSKKLQPEVDPTEFEDIIKSYVSPAKISPRKNTDSSVCRLIYSDVHIGMTPNKNGRALYDSDWSPETQEERVREMAHKVIENDCSTLIIDDLGDYLDGWNQQTARGGHPLPQNLDNRGAYRQGLMLKRMLLDLVVEHFDEVLVHNVTMDNHSSDFAFTVAHAFKQIAEVQYSNVHVRNMERFMEHYFVGRHCFILTHGKDDKNMKFGMKPKIDDRTVTKIEEYIRVNSLTQTAEWIELSKGDSHCTLYDMSSSDVFDYMNYPAFSPSSEWVSTNYKRGRSGFAVQVFNSDSRDKKMTTHFF